MGGQGRVGTIFKDWGPIKYHISVLKPGYYKLQLRENRWLKIWLS